MTTLQIYRTPEFTGFFEVNELHHTITAGNKLFEVRYRHGTGEGNGFNAPSETYLTDPDCGVLIKRLRELHPMAIKISG